MRGISLQHGDCLTPSPPRRLGPAPHPSGPSGQSWRRQHCGSRFQAQRPTLAFCHLIPERSPAQLARGLAAGKQGWAWISGMQAISRVVPGPSRTGLDRERRQLAEAGSTPAPREGLPGSAVHSWTNHLIPLFRMPPCSNAAPGRLGCWALVKPRLQASEGCRWKHHGVRSVGNDSVGPGRGGIHARGRRGPGHWAARIHQACSRAGWALAGPSGAGPGATASLHGRLPSGQSCGRYWRGPP